MDTSFDHGFYRVAAVKPPLHLADPAANAKAIVRILKSINAQGVQLAVFPELAVTGYSCADLFAQDALLKKALTALIDIKHVTKSLQITAIIGVPLAFGGRLFNVAAVVGHGKIWGFVPKSFIPNYKEFYEKRWFVEGRTHCGEEIVLDGDTVPFGVDLMFEFGEAQCTLGIEICEDLWAVIPPSLSLALAGCNIIANLSASDELVAKSKYRRDLVVTQSSRALCGYIYSSSGVEESSSDLVYGGHTIIAENGLLLAEGERFVSGAVITCADLDCTRLKLTRIQESSFRDQIAAPMRRVNLPAVLPVKKLERQILARPFVPEDDADRAAHCSEIVTIQSHGLMRRLIQSKLHTMVIGVSGGLDSTLTLLVCARALVELEKQNINARILAVSMPGFGTSDETAVNTEELCKAIDCDLRVVDIKAASASHLRDIGQEENRHDVVFENAQARERMQVLFDLANKVRGLVVGTSDLSELALGWTTFGGDHMSMYNVNCGVPKTLVQYVISWFAENSTSPKLKAVLKRILATPISPELLPPAKDGSIAQRTEAIVGPYELNDFFMFHVLRYGASPKRILFLAQTAFAESYSSTTIRQHLKRFLERFFSSQFKRNCLPDGPKVGMIALSPRSDWRMPSDAEVNLWLSEIQ